MSFLLKLKLETQKVSADDISLLNIVLHLSHGGAPALGSREGVVLFGMLEIYVSDNVLDVALVGGVVILKGFLCPLDTRCLRHTISVHLIYATRYIFIAITLSVCNALVIDEFLHILFYRRGFGRSSGTFAFAG